MRDPHWKKPDPPRPASEARLRAMCRQLVHEDDADGLADMLNATRFLRREDRLALQVMINKEEDLQ